MTSPPRPITAIDEKYRVIARVGRGGVADVNLAVARGPGGFNKLVVLKSLREELRGNETYSKLFMAEARLNAQLSHPHIVQTNEIFEFDGLPVIVMEYLQGQSLGAVVKRARQSDPPAPFDQSMHLRVLSDILHALDYAHNKRGLDGHPLSLVHCDVTPQNIFLTYEGEVKLLDFGIAKQVSTKIADAADEVLGKMRYMPPEQILDEGLDQRTDLYAVGVLAWEAAAGVRLWSDVSDDEIKHAVMNGSIPRPSSVTEDVDPELERIVMRALEPEKEDRYPTAITMAGDLDAYLGISGTQLRSRDIGAAVAALFVDRRARTEAVVAEQLATLAALPEGSDEALQLVDLPRIPLTSDFPPPLEGPRKKRRALPLAAILAAIGLGLGSAALVSGNPADEIPPSSDQPERVELRITAFPKHAAITLDGEALRANPYVHAFERSSQQRKIRVTAPGHKPEVRNVTLDESTNIVVALQKLAPPTSPVTSSQAVPPDASATPTGQSPPRPRRSHCNPPSYFDERGIKHFKPHCL